MTSLGVDASLFDDGEDGARVAEAQKEEVVPALGRNPSPVSARHDRDGACFVVDPLAPPPSPMAEAGRLPAKRRLDADQSASSPSCLEDWLALALYKRSEDQRADVLARMTMHDSIDSLDKLRALADSSSINEVEAHLVRCDVDARYVSRMATHLFTDKMERAM